MEKDHSAPEGYNGNIAAEAGKMRPGEQNTDSFVLRRARSLVWQAVRHAPHESARVDICRNWLCRARLWAERRRKRELAPALAGLEEILREGLALLAGKIC
ncbi:MAG: hypothetical protein LBQ63_07920 [Deltaproteobacteria bacterium]|jgi:hypothetical protein|nr:hypothetical protein [Deltaproteobacteria bacterium]